MEQNQPTDPNGNPTNKSPISSFLRAAVIVVALYLFFSLFAASVGRNNGSIQGDRFIVHLKESINLPEYSKAVDEIDTFNYAVGNGIIQVELPGRSLHIPTNNISYVEIYKSGGK